MKKGVILGSVGSIATAILCVVIWLLQKNKTTAKAKGETEK